MTDVQFFRAALISSYFNKDCLVIVVAGPIAKLMPNHVPYVSKLRLKR